MSNHYSIILYYSNTVSCINTLSIIVHLLYNSAENSCDGYLKEDLKRCLCSFVSVAAFNRLRKSAVLWFFSRRFSLDFVRKYSLLINHHQSLTKSINSQLTIQYSIQYQQQPNPKGIKERQHIQQP